MHCYKNKELLLSHISTSDHFIIAFLSLDGVWTVYGHIVFFCQVAGVQIGLTQRGQFRSLLFMLTDTKMCLTDTRPTGNIPPSRNAQ